MEIFRQNELKGELDPAIFYQNQVDNRANTNINSKRSMNKLKLEFDSNEKENNVRELEAQEQIKNLNF